MSGQYWYEKRIDARGDTYNVVVDKRGNWNFRFLLAAYIIGMVTIVLVILPAMTGAPGGGEEGGVDEEGGSYLLSLLMMLVWTFGYLRISNRMVERRTKPGDPVPDIGTETSA